MPSRRMVFCPVTTSFRSVRFMFFRLSEIVWVMLSVVSSFCANSSCGTSGRLGLPAAATVMSEGVLSSISSI